MLVQGFRSSVTALAMLAAALLLLVPVANASVSVVIQDSNMAIATISLTDANNNIYNGTVTITFDDAVNLSADSLNLTAELVDPNNPPGTLPANVSIDPAFPVLVSVEPPVAIYLNGFESNQTGNGNLAFYDTYQFEMHTADLACSSSTSTYRLYKAPHGSNVFADVSDGIFTGSVRARGRGGAFSQFLVVKDSRQSLVVVVQKLGNLTTRLTTSSITGTLLTTLTDLLVTVGVDIGTLNFAGADGVLSDFISDVTTGAENGDIANEWVAGGSLSNDAGELLSLAETLQFTLGILQNDPLCLPPSS